MSTHSLMLMPHWPSKELYESCFDFFGFNVWEKNRNDRNCCVHVHIYAKPRHKLWFIINCRENMWWIFWKGSSSQDIKSPGTVIITMGKTLTNPVLRKIGSLQVFVQWLIGSFASSKGPTLSTITLLPMMCLSKRFQKDCKGQRLVLCKTIALDLIFGDSVSLINIDKFLIMDPAPGEPFGSKKCFPDMGCR